MAPATARRRPGEPGAPPHDKRRRRVEAAVASPVAFGELYVKPEDPNWMAAGELPLMTKQLLVWMARVRRGVIITPPEFLKTTALHTYGLWLTYRAAQLNRLARLAGMWTSEEQKHSERNLSVIAWHIENNPRLRADFVDVAGEPLVVPDPDEDKWTDSEIVVRRPGKSKDPTWQAKGVAAKGVQGARLTHVIGDDVITPRSADSPAEQKKALRLWDKQISTRLLEHGQALLAGNFNHPRDLVSTLEARPTFATFRRPALHVPGDVTTAPDDATDPTAIAGLPEKWPKRRLDAVRKDSPGSFRAVYLLDGRDEAGQYLREEWVTIIHPDETPLEQSRFVIATDGAPGSDDAADPDFMNISVLAIHGEHADLIVSHDVRAETTSQVDLVGHYAQRYGRVGLGLAVIGVPKVALDHYFRGAVTVGHPELKGLLAPIGVKGSKFERLKALGPPLKTGFVRVWESAWSSRTSAPHDQPQELTLQEQWVGFDAIAHDDKLDGLDVGIRAVREFGLTAGRRKVKLKGTSAR